MACPFESSTRYFLWATHAVGEIKFGEFFVPIQSMSIERNFTQRKFCAIRYNNTITGIYTDSFECTHWHYISSAVMVHRNYGDYSGAPLNRHQYPQQWTCDTTILNVWSYISIDFQYIQTQTPCYYVCTMDTIPIWSCLNQHNSKMICKMANL